MKRYLTAFLLFSVTAGLVGAAPIAQPRANVPRSPGSLERG